MTESGKARANKLLPYILMVYDFAPNQRRCEGFKVGFLETLDDTDERSLPSYVYVSDRPNFPTDTNYVAGYWDGYLIGARESYYLLTGKRSDLSEKKYEIIV